MNSEERNPNSEPGADKPGAIGRGTAEEGGADEAKAHPEQAVDDIEERVVGHSAEESQEPSTTDPAPAIEQDLEREDLGTPDAADEPPG